MKKGYFKAKDLKEFLIDVDDDMDIFIRNSVNLCGNISEMAEAKEDVYGFFGKTIPCIIFDTAQNVNLDDDK